MAAIVTRALRSNAPAWARLLSTSRPVASVGGTGFATKEQAEEAVFIHAMEAERMKDKLAKKIKAAGKGSDDHSKGVAEHLIEELTEAGGLNKYQREIIYKTMKHAL